MRWYFVLLPTFMILVTLSWGPGAVAHPCHDPAEHSQPKQSHTQVMRAAVQAAASETDRHCRCCTAECQMQCAGSVAAPGAFEAQIFHGRHRFEPVPMAARLGRRPAAELDPPRPSA
jgi:hypothetical protein